LKTRLLCYWRSRRDARSASRTLFAERHCAIAAGLGLRLRTGGGGRFNDRALSRAEYRDCAVHHHVPLGLTNTTGAGFSIVNSSSRPFVVAAGQPMDFLRGLLRDCDHQLCPQRLPGGNRNRYDACGGTIESAILLATVVPAPILSVAAPCTGPDVNKNISFGVLLRYAGGVQRFRYWNPFPQDLTVSPLLGDWRGIHDDFWKCRHHWRQGSPASFDDSIQFLRPDTAFSRDAHGPVRGPIRWPVQDSLRRCLRWSGVSTVQR